MPMTREEKMEKVQRLRTAHKRTKHMFENEDVTWELHAGTDIARRWTVITASYSGLEQTIKYLIAEEEHLSIQELIDYAVENIRTNNSTKRNYLFRTHNIALLYRHLGVTTQDSIQEFYGRFQSLHNYIPIRTVGDFLERVSGQDGAGYERWRYALIEERELPPNSAEALLAIWGVCVEAAETRIRNNQKVRMPNEILAKFLFSHLDKAAQHVSVDRHNRGEAFVHIRPEMQAWLRSSGHPLNAFAQALWHFKRYGSHGVENASEWFSDTLQMCIARVSESPARWGMTSLKMVVERAQGNMSEGASIIWSPETARFESIPWSLERRVQSAMPLNPVLVDDYDYGQSLPDELWKLAREDDYKVLENRQHIAQRSERVWFQTLQIQSDARCETVPILTVWESPIDRRFCIVQECASEKIAPNLRSWLNVVRQWREAERA